MGERKKYEPGTFCWAELGTTDAADAKRFYAGLFGWQIREVPMGPGSSYTIFQVGGKDVAALYQQMDEQREQGVPPHWLSYVSVKSADDSAKEAAELGAHILMAPFDVMDVGRMTLLQDPAGAVFALWEPKEHIGAGRVNEHGTVCWNELATRDHVAAGTFYTRLFGWSTKAVDAGPTPYTQFFNGDRAAGGMLQLAEEWGDVPPHWMVYFAVDDCDTRVDLARSLGGDVKMPPTDIPTIGRFAVLQDPQGAVFSIIRLENPAD